MKKFVKMNKTNNHLSLGNFCNYVKELSINKNSTAQSEIICTIFNITSCSDTTINNYCTGIRRISDEYKEIYIKLRYKFQTDKSCMVDIIFNLKNLINGIYCPSSNFEFSILSINNDIHIYELSFKLYNLAKNDTTIPRDFINKISILLDDKNFFEFICNCLFFIVLDKVQPVIDSNNFDIINNIIKSTKIGADDLSNYINLLFTDEINYYHKLINMSSNSNPYALMELGMKEVKGYITDYPRFDIAYEYFKKAALFDHPNAVFMKVKIGITKLNLISDESEIFRAIDLGSVAAINFAGLCYLNGYGNFEKNLDLAIIFFEKAALKNYPYAFNNLGLIYENNNDHSKALSFFKKSALLHESYGCNKLGLYYYKKKNYSEAFNFFKIGIQSEIIYSCYYNYYNLASLFFENGCSYLNIEKNLDLAISYYEIAAKYNNYESMLKLILIYKNKYISIPSDYYMAKFLNLKYSITMHPKFNKNDKIFLEENLKIINEKLIINE